MESCIVIEKPVSLDAAKVQQLPASVAPDAFTSHSAQLEAGDLQCTLRVLKMNGSTMLFVHDKNVERLDELAVAMPTRGSSTEIVATTFLGDHGQTDSLVLATKLSKRYKRQFYVSFNVALDFITRPLFEKALVSYMQQHPKQFV